MSDQSIRLQKFLSQAGVCSRRQAESWMLEGRIKVNGEVVREMGARVDPSKDQVQVDEIFIEGDRSLVYLLVHKPIGVITSLSDPEERDVIADLIPDRVGRVWPVGRLDWSSDGLVIMTNDGRLTWLLTHPSHSVDKVYHVKLRGELTHQDPGLSEMRRGIVLPDGYKTSSAEVEILNSTGKHTWVEIILHEGRNRQIRRMCEAVGHTVLRLRRVAVGTLELEDLPAGAWRPLTLQEVFALYKEANSSAPKELKKRMAEGSERVEGAIQRPIRPRKPVKDGKKGQNKRLGNHKKDNRGDSEPKKRDDRGARGSFKGRDDRKPARGERRDDRGGRRDDRGGRRDDRGGRRDDRGGRRDDRGGNDRGSKWGDKPRGERRDDRGGRRDDRGGRRDDRGGRRDDRGGNDRGSKWGDKPRGERRDDRGGRRDDRGGRRDDRGGRRDNPWNGKSGKSGPRKSGGGRPSQKRRD